MNVYIFGYIMSLKIQKAMQHNKSLGRGDTACSKSQPEYKFGYNVFLITQNIKDFYKSVINKRTVTFTC
jgi:hypothetical protein